MEINEVPIRKVSPLPQTPLLEIYVHICKEIEYLFNPWVNINYFQYGPILKKYRRYYDFRRDWRSLAYNYIG